MALMPTYEVGSPHRLFKHHIGVVQIHLPLHLSPSSLQGAPQECPWLSSSSPASSHQEGPWSLLSLGAHVSWGAEGLSPGDRDLFSPQGAHGLGDPSLATATSPQEARAISPCANPEACGCWS